jgi:hypothetical protein
MVMRVRTNHHRGIALLDVIIGSIMLGVGLAVVISLSSRSLATQTDGERRLVASWLADELLNMVLVEGPVLYPRMYDTTGQFYPPFEEYYYEVDIRDTGVGQPYRVTATVGWNVGSGGGEYITIQTFIAERLGEQDQLREPKEFIDREQRHYERRFGE